MDLPSNKDLAQIMLLFDRRINGIEKNMEQLKGAVALMEAKLTDMALSAHEMRLDADSFMRSKQLDASAKLGGNKLVYSKDELLKIKSFEVAQSECRKPLPIQSPQSRVGPATSTTTSLSQIQTPLKWPIVSPDEAEKIISAEFSSIIPQSVKSMSVAVGQLSTSPLTTLRP